MRLALALLMAATSCPFVARAADVAATLPAACGTGPLAIQIEQQFSKHESYDVAGPAVSSFAPRYSRQTLVITVSRRAHGQAQAILPLSLDGRRLHGAGAMAMEAEDHIHARGSTSCSRKRMFAINWTLDGTVSEQCTIDLTIVRDWTEQGSAQRCEADVFGLFGSLPPFSQTWSVSLRAEQGDTTKRENSNFKTTDIATLTVLRADRAQ